MDDIVIAGGGPAGGLAAWLLARQGYRVTVFDRARFPRPKLCGDTVNPGAMALLERHLDVTSLRALGQPIEGMRITGPGGVVVEGTYGAGVSGLGITRDRLDAWLMDRACAAGARFVEAASVLRPAVDEGGVVGGVVVRDAQGHERAWRARVTLAADGRRSRLAQALGLTRTPMRPRRWVVGAYFSGVDGLAPLGEMHVRREGYLGVAPTRDGLANACFVSTREATPRGWDAPLALLQAAIDRDRVLAPRFHNARPVTPPVVLGPLAVDARSVARPGIFLLGDAAGFVDPMTGDGIHLAWQAAELATDAVRRQLEGGSAASAAGTAYSRALVTRLGLKRAFDRTLRGLVGVPSAVDLAARVAQVWPGAVRTLIRVAGDVVPARS